MKSQNILITFVAVLMFATLTQSAQAQCPADVNHDHIVDGTDLTAILSTWGTNGGSAGGDINGDGTVNGLDLAFVLSGWGGCPFQSWATVLEWVPNAAVVTNVTMRNAITASGLPWRVRDNSSSIEMLLVPAGTFTMGCSASTQYGCYSEESPTHQVTLTQAFYMGRYEVTQAQWLAKMGSNPSYYVLANGYSSDTTKPVESVSWNIVASTGGFMSVTGLRLPTEAEWEYAYRAGTTTAFHSYPAQPNGFNDDTLLRNIAWFFSPVEGSQTHAVGGKLANGLGLHDMAGNVREWCQDWLGPYPSGSVTNPTGPTGSFRLLRGGFGGDYSDNCRASRRNAYVLFSGSGSIGFRVARTP
jgi:formylglycine-generating enzyme required for sulfatase activity